MEIVTNQYELAVRDAIRSQLQIQQLTISQLAQMSNLSVKQIDELLNGQKQAQESKFYSEDVRAVCAVRVLNRLGVAICYYSDKSKSIQRHQTKHEPPWRVWWHRLPNPMRFVLTHRGELALAFVMLTGFQFANPR
jgi:hypothetical protein